MPVHENSNLNDLFYFSVRLNVPKLYIFCVSFIDTDIEGVVMKLQTMFSYCDQEYLEDIVSQCNGNYQQAYDLLNA